MRLRGVVLLGQGELIEDLYPLADYDRADRLRHLAFFGLAVLQGRCPDTSAGDALSVCPPNRATTPSALQPIEYDVRINRAYSELIADLEAIPTRHRGERLRALAGVGLNAQRKTYQVVALSGSHGNLDSSGKAEPAKGSFASKGISDLVGRMSLDFG